VPEKNLLPVIATGDHAIEQSFGMNLREMERQPCQTLVDNLTQSDTTDALHHYEAWPTLI
jgi:hypothetical protein